MRTVLSYQIVADGYSSLNVYNLRKIIRDRYKLERNDTNARLSARIIPTFLPRKYKYYVIELTRLFFFQQRRCQDSERGRSECHERIDNFFKCIFTLHWRKKKEDSRAIYSLIRLDYLRHCFLTSNLLNLGEGNFNSHSANWISILQFCKI